MMRPIVFHVARQLPAPPALNAIVAGAQINLRWTDGTPAATSWGNPANEIGFRIERRTGTEPWVRIGSALANATAYSDTAIAYDATYRYRVIAFNAAGDSPSSIIGIAPIAAPTNLTATPTTPGVGPIKVTLRWKDNSNNEAGFIIKRAVKTAHGGVFTQVGQVGTNVQKWVDTTVVPVATYTYRVIAFNARGASTYASVDVTTPSTARPAAPTNVQITEVGATTITVGWTDASNNETAFRVRRGPSASGPWTVMPDVPPGTTQYQDSGLTSGTPYYYQVRSVNGFGMSPWTPATPVWATTP